MPSSMQNLLKRLAASSAFARGQTSGIPGPIELVVESTNRCNQRCVICPRSESEKGGTHLAPTTFAALLDDVRGQTAFVDLSLGGEPLLHPSICDLIAMARERGMAVYLQTNATVLTEKLGRDLIAAGLDLITLSLDAATPPTYARLRPPGPDLGEVEQRTEEFLRLARERRGPFTMVQMVCVEENRGEERAFAKQWSKLADAVRFKNFDDRAGLVRRPGAESATGDRPLSAPCPRLWRGMAVLAGGTAVPCCFDPGGRHPLGDAQGVGLPSIWNGPELTAMRAAHAAGERSRISLCRECGFPGSRLKETLALTLIEPVTARKLAARFTRIRSSD